MSNIGFKLDPSKEMMDMAQRFSRLPAEMQELYKRAGGGAAKLLAPQAGNAQSTPPAQKSSATPRPQGNQSESGERKDYSNTQAAGAATVGDIESDANTLKSGRFAEIFTNRLDALKSLSLGPDKQGEAGGSKGLLGQPAFKKYASMGADAREGNSVQRMSIQRLVLSTRAGQDLGRANRARA